MKKLFLPLLLLLVSATASTVSAYEHISDSEIIIQAVASSHPNADLGAKTAICAVILNRIEDSGFGSTASEVIRADESGFDPTLLCDPIDEKNYRITRDAYLAASCGADPTGGMLYFEKLPEPSRKDNIIEFFSGLEISKYSAVIGGYGFY